MQISTQETELKHYQQILLRNPKDINAQIHCGNLCAELGRFEEAAGYFRRLLRVFKTNQDVRNALCFALQSLGNEAHTKHRFTIAEACFQEALQYQPNNAAYWYNLGNAQRELGHPKEALKSFLTSVKIDPEDADTLNNLGNVYRELGQLDQAILSYKQALQINPSLHHALAHLVHQQQHICDWQDLE
ncbi:MAG TPA: tetratricopeptide repeat protein, partial [Methylotenera sp.]|nr:tetratricopeptide repeat protein [Methylotenera sp.]